jgi:antitoxin (DNA-binding transcriptional repressor) of toxin-antitoxin stability system
LRRSPSAACYPSDMAHALRATVRAGHLVVDEPVDLPEGTVVDLVPIPQTAHPRPKFGSVRGRVQMAPDFDAPLDDFADYVVP